MCGILLAYGKGSVRYVRDRIRYLEHRGPDGVSYYDDDKLSMGFVRLAINDKSANGKQPYSTKNYVSSVVGEIYNHIELKDRYDLELDGGSDTNIVPCLFEELGHDIIDHLDGFYSGLLFDKNTGDLFCIRDYIGKKNLFIVKKENMIVISNELKAIQDVNDFEILPKGVSKINLNDGSIELMKSHSIMFKENNIRLKPLLVEAVKKRIPAREKKFGVFLSGGLDSSIIASIVNKFSDDVIYYILGGEEVGKDFHEALKVVDHLKLKDVKIIDLPERKDIPELINKVVYSTESYNPSIISNGICSHILSREAKIDGLKVVIVGEGADELFYGYHYLQKKENWRELRSRLIDDMFFTELRRIDLASMYNSIEVRCPFLDKEIFSFTESLEYSDFFNDDGGGLINKYILRKEFEDFLPNDILYRKKMSFDVGSGIRKLVVDTLKKGGKSEKAELFRIWKKHFPGVDNPSDKYFHSYPVFNQAISKRGGEHVEPKTKSGRDNT